MLGASIYPQCLRSPRRLPFRVSFAVRRLVNETRRPVVWGRQEARVQLRKLGSRVEQRRTGRLVTVANERNCFSHGHQEPFGVT